LSVEIQALKPASLVESKKAARMAAFFVGPRHDDDATDWKLKRGG